jgi:hypothetical protein
VLKRRHSRQSPLKVGLEGWLQCHELCEVHLRDASAFARHGWVGTTPVGLCHNAEKEVVSINGIGLQVERPLHPVEVARNPGIAHLVGRNKLAKTEHVGLAHANPRIHAPRAHDASVLSSQCIPGARARQVDSLLSQVRRDSVSRSLWKRWPL